MLTSVSLLSSHLWQPFCSPWAARFPASLVPGPCLTTALPFLKEVQGCLCFTTKEMNQITGLSQGIFSNSGVFSKSFFSDTLFSGSLLKLLWKDLRGSKTWERAWRLTDHPFAPSNEQCTHLCTHRHTRAVHTLVHTHMHTHVHTCPSEVQCSISPTRGHKKWALFHAITLPHGRVDLNLRTGYFSGPHCLELDWPPLGHQWFCCSPKPWPSKAPHSASGWSIWTASLNRIPRASPVTSSQ